MSGSRRPQRSCVVWGDSAKAPAERPLAAERRANVRPLAFCSLGRVHSCANISNEREQATPEELRGWGDSAKAAAERPLVAERRANVRPLAFCSLGRVHSCANISNEREQATPEELRGWGDSAKAAAERPLVAERRANVRPLAFCSLGRVHSCANISNEREQATPEELRGWGDSAKAAAERPLVAERRANVRPLAFCSLGRVHSCATISNEREQATPEELRGWGRSAKAPAKRPLAAERRANVRPLAFCSLGRVHSCANISNERAQATPEELRGWGDSAKAPAERPLAAERRANVRPLAFCSLGR
ncbi:hypothetical protein HPB52_004084 [Rhipicephalus sanguineus]|uniref:Uncharacterized protein n=1 Tax=Rhipicephalus sanguineus TaxID=34632 RepID=A0A9D4T8H9_RHISA|nr:hypothetical protein HPB52_004084 [Rhipicephalus sanguineus]